MHLNDPRDFVEVDSILHLVHQIAKGRVRQRLQGVARLASGTHQEVFVEHPVHLCRWWFSRGVGGGFIGPKGVFCCDDDDAEESTKHALFIEIQSRPKCCYENLTKHQKYS